MSLNDAANILAGFLKGSKDIAEHILIEAGYSEEQVARVKQGYFIGPPDNK